MLAELLQRHRLVVHDPLLDDVALPRIEATQGLEHALLHDVALFLFGDLGVREVGAVHDEVHVRGAAVLAHRSVEREVAAFHPLLHLQHFGGLDPQLARDRAFGGLLHVARDAVELLQLATRARQAEEQLSLRLRGAQLDQAPALEDVVLDEGADPPHRVGDQADALVGVELLHRLHQADVSFLDQVGHLDAVAAVFVRDLDHEAQVRGDQLVGRVQIAASRIEPGETLLFIDREQRVLVDFRQVHGERASARRKGGRLHAGSSGLGTTTPVAMSKRDATSGTAAVHRDLTPPCGMYVAASCKISMPARLHDL